MILLSPHSSPAERWLARSVRAAAGDVRPEGSTGDGLPFEEAAVLWLARRHRLAPLLHRGLVSGRIEDSLSARFRADCRRIYYAAARRNAVALAVGRELREVLAARAIPAAPLAGWALIEGPPLVHADAATRPIDGLELIVPRGARIRAMNLLQKLGFARLTASVSAFRGGHQVAFHRRVAGVNLFVELHWAWSGPENLMRTPAIPGERFLAGLCVEPEAGCGMRVPTRVGSVLFGAVHAACHGFERWVWLLDLHRLVTLGGFDWSACVAAARAWRMRRPLYVGLMAVRELLGTRVPAETLAGLAPGPVRRRLLHRSLAGSIARPGAPQPARVARLLLGESWWDVARTAARSARSGNAGHGPPGRRPSARRAPQPAGRRDRGEAGRA